MKQSSLLPLFLLSLLLLASDSRSAVVGPAGYANDFTTQPVAADWATVSRAGQGVDTYDIDADVATISAAAVTARTTIATADPAVQLAQATWSSVGLYLQTRPTGNRWTALMGKFVNNTGTNATEINLTYLFTVGPPASGGGGAGATTVEETGTKVYYSLSGQSNSWINLDALNNISAAAGSLTLSTNVSLNWTNGGALFLLWVDDNAAVGTDPGDEIDNFSLAVTAGSPPPMTVVVTAPANNGLFLSGAVPQAAAAVSYGTAPYTVQYFLSSGAGNTTFTSAGTSGAAPYNVSLGALTPGVYNLYAVVTDSAGTPATAGSTTNTFSVADPINITLASPANNSTFDNTTAVNGSVTLSGGTAPYSVQFYLDNNPNGGSIASAPFQRNFGALFVGDHTIKASVTDANNWVSNSSIATVHITGPLGVDLTPANGSSFNFGQPVTLTAAPGGGTAPYAVTFFTNGQPAGTVSSAPFTLDLGILPVGSFTSYAHANDSSTPSAQQANSPTNSVTILPNPTIVALTSPTNGQTAVSGQPFTMAATANVLAPVSVTNVEFFFDGASLGSDTTAPYSGLVPAVSDGTHTAYALASDTLGRKTYSPTNVVTSVLDPLANDNFANRFAIGTPALVSGSNVGATTETGEQTGQGFPTWGASLWYKWTPPVSGTANINIIAPFQMIIAVYTGTDVAALTRTAFNVNGFNVLNSFSFPVVAGTEYSIQASGLRPFGPGGGGPPATGSFQLQLSMPPSVTITSPTNRSVFPAASNVLVSATASSVAGTVTSVQFYRIDGNQLTLLSTVSNAPYSFLYSNAIPATNSLVARVNDSVNQSAFSSTVNLAFFSDGVTIVTPADGTIFPNANPIRVGAVGLVPSGSITNVEFFVDDVKFAQSSTPPFTNAWTNVTSGAHRLTARGTDDSGNFWQSTPIFIAVPKVLVPFGSVWKYLDDNSDQGTNWITPSFNDSTWASGPAPLGYGDSNMRPEATTNSFGPDPNNKYITTYYRQTFTATGLSATTNYSLTIERDDGAVVYLNGVEVGRFNMPAGVITNGTFAAANAQDDGTAQFTISINPALLNEGANVFAVEIHQDAVNSSDTWFQMQLIGILPVIRNASPSVALTIPANDAFFLAPRSITLEASASDSDGSVTNVQFLVDGVKIGADADFPYSVVWDAPTIGSHVLTALATDNGGATKVSTAVTVKIYDALGSPFAKITTPANGMVVEGPILIPVAATASALDSVTHVEFFANGLSIGDAPSSPYSLIWNAPFGVNSLTAVAYGADGKTGTSAVTTVTVTIPPTNTVAPYIVSQNPPAGGVVTSLTNIQITFSERVQGVNASDLLINGIPATGVTGSGSNYNFTFPQPPYFEVSVTWDAGHGITDFGYPANLPFDELAVESRWEYDLIDRTPPTIVSRSPAQNALVTNLSQITVKFSEPVSGVDASDLLVSGVAATAVTGDGTNFTFTVVQPASGTVNVTWSTNNGIADLGADGPNAFDGTSSNAVWSFTLDARFILVQTNSSNWQLLKGLAEASDPTNAWRDITFDSSTWSNAPAPFFYGDPYSTGLSNFTQLTDMRNSYSSIFLRKEFVIDNRSTVTNLFLSAQSDDGFIAWINGVEVQRYNVAAGELGYNALALTASPEPNNNGAAYIVYALTNVDSYLVNGTNVLAVQAFNESLTASSDFGFNAQLYTYLADIARTPPRLLSANPSSGSTILTLRSNSVTFSEPVSGVDASDLLVNGVAATNVFTTNGILYTFRYPQPAFGPVTLTWAPNHGIVDFDSPPKPFNGTAPSSIVRYTLNNLRAPGIVGQIPAVNSTNISLTNVTVTFSKAVVGVNASDFLVNGVPATGMISNSTTSYKFTFPQPPFGPVAISWAANHGIHDTETPSNDFDAARAVSHWNYTLIDPTPSVAITSPATGLFLQAPATLTVRATATDNDGTISLVEFFANGSKFGEAAAAPYTNLWANVTEGQYTLRAVATDNSGLRGTSAPVVVTVITSVPIALLRGPYLQVGTPVSGVVRWRTDIASESLVWFGTDPANLAQSVLLPALTNEHIVQVSGLQPRTKYYYSIGSSAQTLATGPNYWFKTSPPVGTREKTRFWVLGDSGTANDNARNVRNAYYSFAKTNDPADFWLMLGDNAYNAGLDTEYQTAVFNMYPDTLRNLFLWPTLGNHETAQAFTIADFPYLHIFTLPQNGEAGGTPSGSPRYYSYDYANIHFISLDSMSSGRGTNTAMAQWLVNDLATSAQEWTVVFFHHPPYTKGSHNSDAETELIEIRQNILPILEANGVDLVLSGHSHCYERSYLLNGHYGLSTTLTPAMKLDGGDGRDDGTGAYQKNDLGQGVVYMVAGNGGQATGGTLNHPAHFLSLNELGSLIIDVVSNRLDVKMLATNGVARDHFTLFKRNNAPTVNNGSLVLDEDTTGSISLSASDFEGDPITFTVVGAPTHGTATFVDSSGVTLPVSDGTKLGNISSLLYRPNPNFNGADALTFKASDPTNVSVLGTITITVTPVNDAPVADSQSVTLNEDTPLDITLTASDVDLDSLNFIVGTPQHGSLTGTAPNLTYTPAPNYFGPDSFTFRADDGQTNSASATVSIIVLPVNDAPVAYSQTLSVDEDTPLRILLAGTDIEGDALTFIAGNPQHGTLSGTAPNLTYTPARDYNGPDQFTYQVRDGQANSLAGLISITVLPVNDAPVAISQSVVATEDTPVAITLRGTDVDGDALTYTAGNPAHGRLSGTPPALVYTPTNNYNGPDEFTFQVNDGHVVSAPATVSITVLPVNDVPVADASATPLRSVISSNNVNAVVVLDGSRSSDADNDPLQFQWVEGLATIGSGSVATVSLPIGSHTILLKVSDGHATATDSIKIAVLTCGQTVDNLIITLANSSYAKNARPLTASLEAARDSFNRGSIGAGINQLQVFQNKVHLQVEPSDPALAAQLIALAQNIIDTVGASSGKPKLSAQHGKSNLKLTFDGNAAHVYVIQTSTDLLHWESVATAKHLGNGKFEFEEAPSAPAKRFYRVLAP